MLVSIQRFNMLRLDAIAAIYQFDPEANYVLVSR